MILIAKKKHGPYDVTIPLTLARCTSIRIANTRLRTGVSRYGLVSISLQLWHILIFLQEALAIHILIVLTLRAPRVLVPTPSTKGGGVEKDPPQYLKNEKCYKPETFGGVRSIL